MTESKYPVMVSVMSELMKKINTDLDELVEMMRLMKEAEGYVLLNPNVTSKIFDNFKRIKELAVTKEEKPISPITELTESVRNLNKELLSFCAYLETWEPK